MGTGTNCLCKAPSFQAGLVTVSFAPPLAGNSTSAVGRAGDAGCAMAGSAIMAIRADAASRMGFMGFLFFSGRDHCPILKHWKGASYGRWSIDIGNPLSRQPAVWRPDFGAVPEVKVGLPAVHACQL